MIRQVKVIKFYSADFAYSQGALPHEYENAPMLFRDLAYRLNLCLVGDRPLLFPARYFDVREDGQIEITLPLFQPCNLLHPRANIHIDRFPMPNAKNPYLGPDHFEHDPVITHTELPVAFQCLS
jgi:hypothetical protein